MFVLNYVSYFDFDNCCKCLLPVHVHCSAVPLPYFCKLQKVEVILPHRKSLFLFPLLYVLYSITFTLLSRESTLSTASRNLHCNIQCCYYISDVACIIVGETVVESCHLFYCNCNRNVVVSCGRTRCYKQQEKNRVHQQLSKNLFLDELMS